MTGLLRCARNDGVVVEFGGETQAPGLAPASLRGAAGDVAIQSKNRQSVISRGALRADLMTGLLRAANNDDFSETPAARFRSHAILIQ